MTLLRSLVRKSSVVILSAVLVLSALAATAYPGEFRLRKKGARYAPVPLVAEPEITLPGTKIKAASYAYIADPGDYDVGRLGFLMEDGRFYFVDSDAGYNLFGDSHFGFYKNYFLMDSWGYGSVAGHVRLMFLFKYDRDSVKLLDVIGMAGLPDVDLDFESSHKRKDLFRPHDGNAWTRIKDVDHDGSPEISLDISTDAIHFIPAFNLFLEIWNDRLVVDLSPALYRPLFEREKAKKTGRNKSDGHYVYGLLSGGVSLENLKAALKEDPGITEDFEGWEGRQRRMLSILDNISGLDRAFHYVNGEKFELVEYDLKRRQR